MHLLLNDTMFAEKRQYFENSIFSSETNPSNDSLL